VGTNDADVPFTLYQDDQEAGMAERVIRQIIDDLDHTEIAEGQGERIEFGFRGVAYQLDLSKANVAKLEKALAPYIEAAATAESEGAAPRPAKKTPRSRKANKRTGRRPAKARLSDIRAWANENGYSVSSRGRIPADVVAAFETAHAG
jgi:hypothetical protein